MENRWLQRAAVVVFQWRGSETHMNHTRAPLGQHGVYSSGEEVGGRVCACLSVPFLFLFKDRIQTDCSVCSGVMVELIILHMLNMQPCIWCRAR